MARRGLNACRVSLLGLAMVSGCNALPDLDFDQCGNGVLEPWAGEDCDSREANELGPNLRCGPAETIGACHYLCRDGASCPPGWGCGQDGVCRRANMGFAPSPTSPAPGSATRLTIGDLDADGLNDAALHSDRSVRVLFSDGGGALVDPVTVDIGRGFAESVIMPARAEESASLVVPLPSGLHIMRSGPDRGLDGIAHAPFDLTSLTGGQSQIVAVERAGAVGDEVLFVHDDARGLAVTTVDNDAAGLVIEGLRLSRLLHPISVADLDDAPRPFRSDELLLAGRGASSVFVVQLGCAQPSANGICPAGALRMQVRAEVPLGAGLSNGARFVDVDGDGLLDIQASVTRDALADEHLIWTRQNQDGSFGPPRPDPRVRSACAGCASIWPLVARDLNGDGPADYVMREGVLHTVATTSTTGLPALGFVYVPQIGPLDTIAEAVVGDFNQDGLDDIVITGQQVEGVELLLAGPRLVYNGFFEPLDGVGRGLRVGDFDGDLIDDLAVVIDEPQGSRVEVLFGQPQGRLQAPTIMGRFGFIQQIETGVVLGTDLASIDGRWDLLLHATPDRSGTEAGAWAVLLGTAQRLMLAPYVLSNALSTQLPISVVAGAFDGQDPGWDLFAFTSTATWTLVSEGEGSFSARSARAHPQSCPLAQWSDCTLSSVTPDGQVLALSPAHPCVAAQGRAPSAGFILQPSATPAPTCETQTLTTTLRSPTSISWGEPQADGSQDCIIAFHGLAGPLQSVPEAAGVLVARYTPGVGLQPTQEIAISSVIGSVHGAVSANVDSDLEWELLIATDSGLYVAQQQDGAWMLEPDPLDLGIGDVGAIRSLAAEDLNQDGIMDILAGTKDDLHILLGQQFFITQDTP